jgi:hypothetical protein
MKTLNRGESLIEHRGRLNGSQLGKKFGSGKGENGKEGK